MECCASWHKGSQAPGVTKENERLRGQHRDTHEPGSSVIPRAVVFKTEFSLTPCKVSTLANRLCTSEALQDLAPEQQVHDAADKIWAARRVYQSSDDLDKMERRAENIAELSQIFIYSCQLRPNSCEYYHISELASAAKKQELTTDPQDTVPCLERDPTVKLEQKKENMQRAMHHLLEILICVQW